jgi:WD40 repeat protein/LmbE family N-acetylglucosaminyl deacetylase
LACLVLATAVPAWGIFPPGGRTAHADPLPDGAVARLGTGRFRLPAYTFGIRLSPDGKLLAAADRNNAVRFLDAATGQELRTLQTPTGVSLLAFDPTGKTLATVWHDGVIRVWDVATGQQLSQLERDQNGMVASLAFSADGKVLAAVSETHGRGKVAARVVEAATGKRLGSLEVLAASRIGVSLSADGSVLATWGFPWFTGRENRQEQAKVGQTVQVWDVKAGKEVRRVLTDRGQVQSAALAPDGKTLALVTQTSTIQLWDLAAGKPVRAWQARQHYGWSLAFAPDGKTLVASAPDATLQAWDLRTGKRLPLGPAPARQFCSLSFAPGGRLLACGLRGQVVVVWDVLTGKVLTPEGGPETGVGAVLFSRDGKTVVTATADGRISAWDPATGKELRRVEEVIPENDVRRRMAVHETGLAFSPDGKYLLAGGNHTNAVRVRETATGQEVFGCVSQSGPGSNLAAAFSPDGAYVAAPQWNFQNQAGTVALWDLASGEELRTLTGLKYQVNSLAVAPGGKPGAPLLALGGMPMNRGGPGGQAFAIHLWDTAAGKDVRTLEPANANGHAVYRMAFSPDGKLLAVSGPGAITLWDVAGGRPLHQLDEPGLPAGPIVFSPDGRALAAGLFQPQLAAGRVALWEVMTGRKRREFGGLHGSPLSLAFSPDGKLLASGCSDTTVLFWDMTGVLLAGSGAKPSAGGMEAAWADLANPDAAAGYRAMRKLAAAPALAVPLLAKNVRPAGGKPADAREMARLVAELDDDRFEVREKAAHDLEALGKAAVPALRTALADRPSAEVRRRVRPMLERLEAPGVPAELVRPFRAVEVLEWVGTAEARQALERLAGGQAEAPLTEQARAALRRLGATAPAPAPARKLRVVVFGAHPDDPESGCGGLIALLAKEGHEVIAAYSTCYRGDRKVGQEPEARVRRREATAACQALGAKPHFFDYAHEKLFADQPTLEAVSAWLKQVRPDVVVTHWPLDTHPNHHVTSSLVWQCYLREGSWGLYFFEVMTDRQSLNFRPDLYLDIGAVRDLKRRALDCHRSQNPDGIWQAHDAMHRRRGAEAGVAFAEAYIRADGSRERPKLPLPFLGRKK